MGRHIYREGDLIEYIETFYNNIHKIHFCVIIEKQVITTTVPTAPTVKYIVLTSEGETREVWEEDMLPMENKI